MPSDNTYHKPQFPVQACMKNCCMSIPLTGWRRGRMGLQRGSSSQSSDVRCRELFLSFGEAKVFGSVFRISEEEHPIVEPHLPTIVGRCLNLEIVDIILTWLVAQGVANLVHVEFEHAIRI